MKLGMYPCRKPRRNRIQRVFRWVQKRQQQKRVLTKHHIYRGRMSYNYQDMEEVRWSVEARRRPVQHLVRERRENFKFERMYGGARRMDHSWLESGGKRWFWDSPYHNRLHRRVQFRSLNKRG